MLKIRIPGLLVLLVSLVACNKEEELTKAIGIEVWGYNVGNAELEVAVDTTIYRSVSTKPDMPVTFDKVYTYQPTQKEVLLTITDKTRNKAVFQQQIVLGGSELELFFPFVYIDGNVLDTKPPAVDTATNKLAFYIHYPRSDEYLDIYLKNDEGQTVYIAQQVQPGGWIYADYLPQEGFKNDQKNVTLYFTKTGTMEDWYFEGNEMLSRVPESGLVFPIGKEKGLVRSYFVTPRINQLDCIRLFKRPKE